MQPYRVSILAAGGGTRVAASESSHKALVRIGDRPVISHIVDLFPDDATIVVAIGHNGPLIRDFLELFYPDRHFIFVEVRHWGKGYGPGHSLKACREYLQQPFYTWTCDTIVGSLPPETHNWAGYSEIEDDVRSYCTLKIDASGAITDYFDKSPVGTTNAWIGAGFVEDFETFWRVLAGDEQAVEGELQVTKALFSLSIKGIEFPDWLDTGNELGLARARERFGDNVMSKPDEAVYFNGSSVIRYFRAEGVAVQKARRAAALEGLVPRVESVRANYFSSEYVPGIDLTYVEDAHEYIGPLMDFLTGKLWRKAVLAPEEAAFFQEDCRMFYRAKTMARLELARERLGVDNGPYRVNGESLPALSSVLEGLPWEPLERGIASSFHGDLNFSNIVLTEKGSFVLLDQRERFGRLDDIGDQYYDLGKLYQSVLWPHSSIRRGSFGLNPRGDHDLEVQIEIPDSLQITRRRLEAWVDEHGYDVGRVRCIGALSLLNSAALHPPKIGRHLYFWGYWNLTRLSFSAGLGDG